MPAFPFKIYHLVRNEKLLRRFSFKIGNNFLTNHSLVALQGSFDSPSPHYLCTVWRTPDMMHPSRVLGTYPPYTKQRMVRTPLNMGTGLPTPLSCRPRLGTLSSKEFSYV